MSGLIVLSLGAGVQSSTLALMMAEGEIPSCDHAIFADTKAEPRVVYEYLEYLKPLLPFPVHVVSAGDIAADFLRALDDKKCRAGQPPLMVWNHEKQKGGRLWRKCTNEYKIAVIRRKVRELRGKGQRVQQLIGISLDEAHRMKPSGVKYITNHYPLIEMAKTRHDCITWIKKRGYKIPPKSACWLCPYMSNQRIRAMRDHHPDDYQKVVEFDEEMRRRQKKTVNGAKITGTLYVHRDCKPIREIDLSTEAERGQGDLFGEECEGMCGL